MAKTWFRAGVPETPAERKRRKQRTPQEKASKSAAAAAGEARRFEASKTRYLAREQRRREEAQRQHEAGEAAERRKAAIGTAFIQKRGVMPRGLMPGAEPAPARPTIDPAMQRRLQIKHQLLALQPQKRGIYYRGPGGEEYEGPGPGVPQTPEQAQQYAGAMAGGAARMNRFREEARQEAASRIPGMNYLYHSPYGGRTQAGETQQASAARMRAGGHAAMPGETPEQLEARQRQMAFERLEQIMGRGPAAPTTPAAQPQQPPPEYLLPSDREDIARRIRQIGVIAPAQEQGMPEGTAEAEQRKLQELEASGVPLDRRAAVMQEWRREMGGVPYATTREVGLDIAGKPAAIPTVQAGMTGPEAAQAWQQHQEMLRTGEFPRIVQRRRELERQLAEARAAVPTPAAPAGGQWIGPPPSPIERLQQEALQAQIAGRQAETKKTEVGTGAVERQEAAKRWAALDTSALAGPQVGLGFDVVRTEDAEGAERMAAQALSPPPSPAEAREFLNAFGSQIGQAIAVARSTLGLGDRANQSRYVAALEGLLNQMRTIAGG